MPWYWSDEIAKTLLAEGRIDSQAAARLTIEQVAFRREESTVDEAANGLLDDDEIPLAA